MKNSKLGMRRKNKANSKFTLSAVERANIEWKEVFLSIAQKIATDLRASQ